MTITFTVDGVKYDFVESDIDVDAKQCGWGYDIYIEEEQDPVNLGDIAYFDNIPIQTDAEKWIRENLPAQEKSSAVE